jgi:RING finger/CHY zinc finger protein 1
MADADKDLFSCPHYKRKCRLLAPCCDRIYHCRFCHDEAEDHLLDRETVRQVQCLGCRLRQPVGENCAHCGLRFGEYSCLDCRLFDDEDKEQYHCPDCRVCRVGGRGNGFHCHGCDMCLPAKFRGAHSCVENASRVNCPVCQEDLHTSRQPSHIPPCHHLIHIDCFHQMVDNDLYACPTCGKAMMDMANVWKDMDKEILDTPMPEEYRDLYAGMQCKDCGHCGTSAFHLVGLKCGGCGGYNTARDKGPLHGPPGPAALRSPPAPGAGGRGGSQATRRILATFRRLEAREPVEPRT